MIFFFLFLGYGVRDLDAPQTCKTDQLGRAWKSEAVPIPPSSSSVSQDWSLLAVEVISMETEQSRRALQL